MHLAFQLAAFVFTALCDPLATPLESEGRIRTVCHGEFGSGCNSSENKITVLENNAKEIHENTISASKEISQSNEIDADVEINYFPIDEIYLSSSSDEEKSDEDSDIDENSSDSDDTSLDDLLSKLLFQFRQSLTRKRVGSCKADSSRSCSDESGDSSNGNSNKNDAEDIEIELLKDEMIAMNPEEVTTPDPWNAANFITL